MEKKRVIVGKYVDGMTAFVIDVISSPMVGTKPTHVEIGHKSQATSDRRVFSKLLPYVNTYKRWSFHLVDF